MLVDILWIMTDGLYDGSYEKTHFFLLQKVSDFNVNLLEIAVLTVIKNMSCDGDFGLPSK